jgi:hypothetical protein
MFLSGLTGSVVALALLAGVMGFNGPFVTFALLLLPVVLSAGVTTFRRPFTSRSRAFVPWFSTGS